MCANGWKNTGVLNRFASAGWTSDNSASDLMSPLARFPKVVYCSFKEHLDCLISNPFWWCIEPKWWKYKHTVYTNMFEYTVWMSLYHTLAPVTLVFCCWVRWALHAASDLGVELQPRLHPGLPVPPILLQPHVPDAVPGSARELPSHADCVIDSRSATNCVGNSAGKTRHFCTLPVYVTGSSVSSHFVIYFPIDYFWSLCPVFLFIKWL